MQEIAREIGVSRTTVSLVLQGKGDEYRISRETQELIQNHVAQSDYRPNYFAKALNRKKSDIVGAVFPDVFESFMGNIIRGLESVLYPAGYSLMISTSNFDREREASILEKMVWQGVDGIILVPTMPFRSREDYSGSHIAALTAKEYPLVVADRLVPGVETHSVLQDDYSASLKMLRSLQQDGFTNTCCVSFDLEASSVQNRLSAYRTATAEAGGYEQYILLTSLMPKEDPLEAALNALLQGHSPPDSWFVTTSGLGEKLIWLLEQLGRRDPVLRFGTSSPWAGKRGVDVREIPHPHQEIGTRSAGLLLELIKQARSKEETAGFWHLFCSGTITS